MKNVDMIIKNGTIVTVNQQMEVIENGCIAIVDATIHDLGKTDEILPKYESEQVIEAESGLIIPGLINAHTHLPMTYFRGMADDLPLMEWLQEHIWPAETKFLSPEFVYKASLHGAAELIRNGVTCFNDMYFFSKEIAEAATKAGLRGIVGEGVLDFPMVGRKSADEHLKYTLELFEQLKSNDLIDLAVAPHAIYSCSQESLMKAYELAASNDLLLHIHVSETEQEVKDSLRNFGKRPVQYLAEMGFLDHKSVFAHGVWVNKQEAAIMAEKQVSNIICTESNLKLASGFTSVKNYLEANVNLCLGTDGVASNNDLDIFSEMDFTAKVHKALLSDPTILPAAEVFKMATINGAKALQMGDKTGSLEIGKKADIVIMSLNDVTSQPLYNVYSHLVYTAKSNTVKNVIINGKLVMRDRELLTLDEEQLLQEARTISNKIKAVD